MGKADVVAAQKLAIVSGQDAVLEQALGAVYDQAALDQKGVDGSFSQADIDAAVAAVKQVDAQALADAQSKAQSDMDALKVQLDAVSAKELSEEQVIASLQGALKSAQDSIAAVFALFPAPIVIQPVPPVQS